MKKKSIESFSEIERKIIDIALSDYAKKLDKLMSQCIRNEQSGAAEKVLTNIKLISKIRDDVNEE